jgi:hypothetical protein
VLWWCLDVFLAARWFGIKLASEAGNEQGVQLGPPFDGRSPPHKREAVRSPVTITAPQCYGLCGSCGGCCV